MNESTNRTINDGLYTNQLLTRELQTAQQRTHARMTGDFARFHQVERFPVGSIVTVQLPNPDELLVLQNPRVHCEVLAEPHPNCYLLRTRFGVLNHLVGTSQINSIPDDVGKFYKATLDFTLC